LGGVNAVACFTVVAFIPAVACVPDVVSGLDIAVILNVAWVALLLLLVSLDPGPLNSVISKRKDKRFDIEAYYRNQTKTF
jgi:hypothetical protein